MKNSKSLKIRRYFFAFILFTLPLLAFLVFRYQLAQEDVFVSEYSDDNYFAIKDAFIDTGGRFWNQPDTHIAHRLTFHNEKPLDMTVTIMTPDQKDIRITVPANSTQEYLDNRVKSGRYELDFQNDEGDPRGTFSIQIGRQPFQLPETTSGNTLVLNSSPADTGGREWIQKKSEKAYKLHLQNDREIEMIVTVSEPGRGDTRIIVPPKKVEEYVQNNAKKGRYSLDFQTSDGNPKGRVLVEVSETSFPHPSN